jgi:hypothetical protein
MKELSRHKISPIHMGKSDTLQVRRAVVYRRGQDTIKTETQIAEFEPKKELTIDTCIFVEPEKGELGLEDGIGAIIGQEIQKKKRGFWSKKTK